MGGIVVSGPLRSKWPSPVVCEPARSFRKSMRMNATRIVSGGPFATCARAAAALRPNVPASRSWGLRSGVAGGFHPTRRLARGDQSTWGLLCRSRKLFQRSTRVRFIAWYSLAAAETVVFAGTALRAGVAAGGRRIVKRPEESDRLAPADPRSSNPAISREVLRKVFRSARPKRLEAVSDRDLLDVVESGVLGLRDAAPVHGESLELDADSVGQILDLSERIRVVADPPRHLTRVTELEAGVVGAEVVGHERLIEIRSQDQRVVLALDRFPGSADLDVASQRVGLVLVEERHAGPEVLHVETEVEVRALDLVEPGEIETEGRADARLVARRELDANPLERRAHREVREDLRAVVDRRRELVRAEGAGGIALIVRAFALSVREEHDAQTEG